MYQTLESLSSLSTWLQLTHNWHSLTHSAPTPLLRQHCPRLRWDCVTQRAPPPWSPHWVTSCHHHRLSHLQRHAQPTIGAGTVHSVHCVPYYCCTPGIKTLYTLYTLLTTIPRHIIIVHPHLFDLALKAVAELSNIDVFNQRQSEAAIAFKSLVSHHHLETSFPVSSQLAG